MLFLFLLYSSSAYDFFWDAKLLKIFENHSMIWSLGPFHGSVIQLDKILLWSDV